MRAKRLAKWVLLLLPVFILLYLYLFFPMLAPDMKTNVLVDTDLWKSSPKDSLSYWYLEREVVPLHELMEKTADSIFVLQPNYARTLRNTENPFVYSTTNFTHKTLFCYSYYLKTGDRNYLKLFWKNTNWMCDNIKFPNDTVAVWKNDNMIFDKYNLEYGWVSAFSQGYGLAVLCRAFQLSNNARYIELAEKVLNSFDLAYPDGGVMHRDENGDYWYLEYPADPPPYVLNGFIYGLFGIYDYYRITNSEKALHYFMRGIKTLKNNLSKYDMGYWSSYDLLYASFCAGYNYHRNIHIPQLKVLYEITREEEFVYYSKRFEEYLREPYLSLFKINFTIDAIQRYLTYKNPVKYISRKYN